MTLTQLLNRRAWVLRRSDSGAEDDYGNPIPSEERTEVVCEVQQRRADEVTEGEVSDAEWLGVFPAGTAFDTGDAIEVEGLGTFEVDGAPWPARNPRTQTESHVEATLKRVAGAGAGS